MTQHRILLTADAVGGVWSYAIDLAGALAPLGVETTLVVLGPSPDRCQLAEAAAVPGLSLIDSGLPLDWTAEDSHDLAHTAASLSLLASEHGVDLVQLHTPALAGVGYPVPVLAVSHSCLGTWWRAMRGNEPMPADFAWRSEAVARGIRAADTIVTPTRAFAELTAGTYGLDHLPTVVHNGRTRQHPAVAEPGPRDIVLAAGRLWDEAKDVATLDAAAALIGAPVVAAGPLAGPSGNTVTLRHARPLGSLCAPALARWMAGRPVFASLSRYEPFGLAALEAAQTGCALVLSDTPGYRELWEGAALFVPAGDADAAARAMDDLLWDRERRARLEAAAHRRARRYTSQAMAAAMLSIYRGLLATPARRSRRAAA